jgi:transposase
MAKKYHVRLSPDERPLVTELITAGKAAARAQTHARILLKADEGPDGPAWSDEQIAVALDVSVRTIERVRETWVTDGLEAALYPKPARAHRPRKLDGEQEAHLIALACSAPPTGKKRWTLRLLANRLVDLEIVDAIAPETVRQTLKKTN